jgi:hypothetical protein
VRVVDAARALSLPDTPRPAPAPSLAARVPRCARSEAAVCRAARPVQGPRAAWGSGRSRARLYFSSEPNARERVFLGGIRAAAPHAASRPPQFSVPAARAALSRVGAGASAWDLGWREAGVTHSAAGTKKGGSAPASRRSPALHAPLATDWRTPRHRLWPASMRTVHWSLEQQSAGPKKQTRARAPGRNKRGPADAARRGRVRGLKKNGRCGHARGRSRGDGESRGKSEEHKFFFCGQPPFSLLLRVGASVCSLFLQASR